MDYNIHVVGAGGTGAFLIQLLAKTGQTFTIWDGDTYEEKNLDRQLVDPEEIGVHKAQVWGERYNMPYNNEFFGVQDVGRDPIIFCCADNHPARLQCIKAADKNRGVAIICGNEETDAEAYFYDWTQRDTPCDPRKYYPEIMTVTHGDPLSPCTGVVLEETPQLAISNSLAAGYAMWLFWFYTQKAPYISDDKLYPLKVSGNYSRIRTTTVEDMLE